MAKNSKALWSRIETINDTLSEEVCAESPRVHTHAGVLQCGATNSHVSPHLPRRPAPRVHDSRRRQLKQETVTRFKRELDDKMELARVRCPSSPLLPARASCERTA